MIELPFVQGTEEWKQFRRQGIGASDVAAIMGISPFQTPYQKWEEKVLGLEQNENYFMKRGTEREQESRSVYEFMVGCKVFPKMIRHPEYPWFFCSLDGISEDGLDMVEIKWANQKVHEMALTGVVIDYYYAQCQAQLCCTGKKSMDFVNFMETQTGVSSARVPVRRDEIFIQKMLEKCEEFYHQYLLAQTPPPLSEKDFQKIEDEEVDLLCLDYERACLACKIEEEKKKELLEKIRSKVNDQNTMSRLFKITKFSVKGNVDYTKIPVLNGLDLEPFRKESRQQWKITKVK